MCPLWRRIFLPCLFAAAAFSVGAGLRAADGHAVAGHDAATHGSDHPQTLKEGERELLDTEKPPITPNRQMAELFVFSLVFFCLYLVVAKKFAWLPLIGGLDARESRVNRALAEAEAARIEAARLLADHQTHLDAVTEQVKAIVAQARNDAEQEKVRIVAEAEAETTALRNRAIGEIHAAREQALSGLDEQIESQVVAATEHVLA